MTKFTLSILFLLYCLSSGFTQNYGIEFDGVNDKISLCHSENFNIGEGFTVEAWIYAYEWRPEQWRGSIVSKDAMGPDAGFAFRAGDNGTLSFVMSVNESWNEIATSPVMDNNQWYHVAAVVDDGDFSLYINGEIQASGSYNGSPTHNIIPLNIGWSPGFDDRGWNGIIDEVRIWNIARTEEAIAASMTAALNGDEEGLAAYLPMNEGSSLNTENLLGCNGSMNGMTEEAWVDGFFIPTADVGVNKILAPDVLSVYQRPTKVSVEVKNFGSEPVTNFPIRVIRNGNTIRNETYSGTLQPDQTIVYTFETPYDFGAHSFNSLEVKTDFIDDSNIQNNGITIDYYRPESELVVNLFEARQHNFGNAGQNQYQDIILPRHTEDFEKIYLHFQVDCPSTGCDPWDQPAAFYLETPGGSYELARYITPYGKGCGPWAIDITDFKSVLKGPVTIRSYIQVWGSSGWLVDASLQFVETGTPIYQNLNALWETNNWVYGDPDISYDLPAQSIEVATNTEAAHMRMTITGHGQGNTENAAEFSNKTHEIMVNGGLSDTHNLWKNDCEFNTCANQFGTWLFDRAGWCPGQEVTPLVHNLSDAITPGSDITLDYELETYTNLLNTGYDGQGHTEPHYKIFAYLVETSTSHFADLNNLRAEELTVATNGDVNSPVFEGVALRIKNTGTEIISGATASYMVNGNFIAEESISGDIEPGSEHLHEFTMVDGFTAGIDNKVIAYVRSDADDNISDDGIRLLIEEDLTVDIDELVEAGFSIYPNPTTDWLTIETDDRFRNGHIRIYDLQGRLLQQQVIQSNKTDLQLRHRGMYMVVLETETGEQVMEKVVVQ
jgi:hypothetical protein